MQLSPKSNFRTFPPHQKDSLCSQSCFYPESQETSSLLSISKYFPFLDVSYKWNHKICDLLWLASFSSMMFSRFIHVVVGIIYFFLLYSWVPFHCMDSSHFVLHSQADGYLHCFLFGAVMKKNEHGGFGAQLGKWQTQVGFWRRDVILGQMIYLIFKDNLSHLKKNRKGKRLERDIRHIRLTGKGHVWYLPIRILALLKAFYNQEG